MKSISKSPMVARFTSLLLLFTLCAGIMVGDHAKAASNNGQSSAKNSGRSAAKKMSAELRERAGRAGADRDTVRVIVQFKGQASPQVNSILKRSGVRVRGVFRNFDAHALELPAAAVAELAAYSEIFYISPDAEIKSLGHVSETTGTDAVRQQTKTSLLGVTTSYTLDGKGIGIAVVDSGVDASHKSFLGNGNNVRVVMSKDFTGENRTDDPYGHGTHVASTAAGNGRISNASYIGIAPEANIVNLRVLNREGKGSVSEDWLWDSSNRERPKVRT